MSYQKTGNILPSKTAALMDQEIAARINLILRNEYQDMSSPLKKLSLKTGIGRNTIKKWYEGRTTPSAGHLIILALHFPAVLKMILDLSEYGHLVEHVNRPNEDIISTDIMAERGTLNVTIKSNHSNLNERQLWFLKRLQLGLELTASDICSHWPVHLRSARRDVAKLKELGLIHFAGAKKMGWYEVI